jgi:hypothetical protein
MKKVLLASVAFTASVLTTMPAFANDWVWFADVNPKIVEFFQRMDGDNQQEVSWANETLIKLRSLDCRLQKAEWLCPASAVATLQAIRPPVPTYLVAKPAPTPPPPTPVAPTQEHLYIIKGTVGTEYCGLAAPEPGYFATKQECEDDLKRMAKSALPAPAKWLVETASGCVAAPKSPADTAEEFAKLALMPPAGEPSSVNPLSLIHDQGNRVVVNMPEELVDSMKQHYSDLLGPYAEMVAHGNNPLLAIPEKAIFWRDYDACRAQYDLDIEAIKAKQAAAKKEDEKLDPYR